MELFGMSKYKIYNASMEEILPTIQCGGNNMHILTDPPYLYLKHKLDTPFDEELLFNESKRLLGDKSFVVLFGRGTAFYRWNTMLADRGFVFKEEIIWNKRLNSTVFNAVVRIHETISISTKKNGIIRKRRIPYIDAYKYDIKTIINDIKRLKIGFNNKLEFASIQEYLENNIKTYYDYKKQNHNLTTGNILNGRRACYTAIKIKEGVLEKSIIEELGIHYKSKHPTQKPVHLIERLIALISDEGDTILDPFMGSGAIGVACLNMGRNYIGIEKDKEYFSIAVEMLKGV